MLTDLAIACRKSGLRVVELPGWKTNRSPGGEDYKGVLAHHTGSYDEIGDTSSDLAYAKWLCSTGREDLDPPLCNIGLSAESTVFVGAAGNANHAGEARASGPMPYAKDGNAIYIGIEAFNSGTQGWSSWGTDAHGNTITQYEGYVRLCAALCKHYGWPASHVRAHRETSVTGKVDPGGIDMDKFRRDIAAEMKREEDEMPNYRDWQDADRAALAKDVADEVLQRTVKVIGAGGKSKEITMKQAIARIANGVIVTREQGNEALDDLTMIQTTLDELND
jgi:hypothetical protein